MKTMAQALHPRSNGEPLLMNMRNTLSRAPGVSRSGRPAADAAWALSMRQGRKNAGANSRPRPASLFVSSIVLANSSIGFAVYPVWHNELRFPS
jgi:hypothetical protein